MSRASRAQVQARVRQAQAEVAERRSIWRDLSLLAPASGTVTLRLREAGEVVAAGTPVLEIVNLDRLFVKIFVPENQIGKIRLGLPARVYVDAFPDEPFPARVSTIASTAEFTPKEVQTRDERVKLVYSVKLALTQNPGHRLTPGMPADAVIRWQEKTPWQKPRW
jgi:HlyD family secretion protein